MKPFHISRAMNGGGAWLLMVATFLAGSTSSMCAEDTGDRRVTVLIVAGQSNILNWHARASELSLSPYDAQVAFYYHTGAPPDRQYAVPFNSTSKGDWTVLGPQHQDPYVKWERDFFGPEITLAREICRSGSGPVAVIKVGYFGTNLARDWAPDSTQGARLYALLQTQIAQALELLKQRKQEYRLGGFFWMQGEADGTEEKYAQKYADNLTAFVARVRHDLGVQDLPFVLGRVGPKPPGDKYNYQEIVRTAQVRAQGIVPEFVWVDTDDLPRYEDGIHLLAPGVMTLGERWAVAWLKLTAKPLK